MVGTGKKWIGLNTPFTSGDTTLTGHQLIQITKEVRGSYNSIYDLNHAYVPKPLKDVEKLLGPKQLAYMKIIHNMRTNCSKAAGKRDLDPSYPLQTCEKMYELLVNEGGLVCDYEEFKQQFNVLATNPSSPMHEDSLVYPLLVAFGMDNIPPKYQLFDTVESFNKKIDFARNETLEGASVQDIGDEQARIVSFVEGDMGKMAITNDYLRHVFRGNSRGGAAFRVTEEMIKENGGFGCDCSECKDKSLEEVASSTHLLTLSHYINPRSSKEHIEKYGNSAAPSALGYDKLVLQKDDMKVACFESHYDDDLGMLAKLGCDALAGNPPQREKDSSQGYNSSTHLTRWYLTHQYNMTTNEGNTVIGDMPITLAKTHRVVAHHPTQKKPLRIVGLPNGGEVTLQTGKTFKIATLIQGAREEEAVVGDVADARCNNNPGLFTAKSIQEKPRVVTSSHTSHDLHHKLENQSAALDSLLGIDRRYTVTDTHYEMNLQDMPRVQELIEKHGGIDNVPRLPPIITFTEEDVELEKKKRFSKKKHPSKKREVIKLKRSYITRSGDGIPAISGEEFRALVNHETNLIIEPGSYDPDEAYAEKLAILKGEGPEESEHYVKLTKSLFVPRAVNESPSTVGGDELVVDESLSTEDDSPDAGESPTIEEGQLKDDYAYSAQEATDQALGFMLETAQTRDVNDTTSLKEYGVGPLAIMSIDRVLECARREGIDHGEDLSKVGPAAKKVSETPANHKEDTIKESPDDVAKPSSAAVSVGKAQFSGLQGTGDDDLPSPPKSNKPTSTTSFDYGEDSDSSVTLPSNPAGESVSKKRKAAILEESDE